jgi:hypothetical protein
MLAGSSNPENGAQMREHDRPRRRSELAHHAGVPFSNMARLDAVELPITEEGVQMLADPNFGRLPS